MSDDPVTLLNLREEPGSTGSRGRWWVAALVVPPVVFGLGILAAFTLPRNNLESAIWLAVGSLGLAAMLCVGFATVSVTKKEGGRIWAMLAALPCVALLIWGMALFGQSKYDEWKRQQAAQQREVYAQQLRADPGLGLREHWAAPENLEKGRGFRESLQDSRVHYSPAQLAGIYAEVPALRREVLENRSCTPEFLTAHLPDALADAKPYSYPMLSAIIQHPNTPLPLLETITLSPKLSVQALQDAKNVLERRKPRLPPPKPQPEAPPLLVLGIPKYDFDNDSTLPAQRFARFQRYEAEVAGKYIGLKIQSLPFRSLPDGREVPAPRTISLSVPGMFHLMEKEDYGNVYFLPENISFEGNEAMKLASLTMSFAIEHNEKLARQKGDPWLDGPSPPAAPKPAASTAPTATVPTAPARAAMPKPLHPPFPDPAYDRFVQLRKHEVAAAGRFIGLLTLTSAFKIQPDGRRVPAFASVVRIIPGTTLSPEKADDRSVYFMSSYFGADTPAAAQQLEFVKEFAAVHNAWVLRQTDAGSDNDAKGREKRNSTY